MDFWKVRIRCCHSTMCWFDTGIPLRGRELTSASPVLQWDGDVSLLKRKSTSRRDGSRWVFRGFKDPSVIRRKKKNGTGKKKKGTLKCAEHLWASLAKDRGSVRGSSALRSALMRSIPKLLLVYLAAFLCIMCIRTVSPSFKEFTGNPTKITLEFSALAKASVDSKAQAPSLQ